MSTTVGAGPTRGDGPDTDARQKTLVERLLSPIADVRQEEAASALLMTLLMFLILGAYYMLKTAREVFILAEPARSLIDEIRGRGALRVCVLPGRLPYAFGNRKGEFVGFDVEMAHRLEQDLGTRLEFVPTEWEQLPDLLARDACDIAMTGIPVTPLRATAMLFSQPYLDEALAFVVRDDLRDRFFSWSTIRALGPMRVAVPDVPYYIAQVRARAPSLQLEPLPSTWTPDEPPPLDALVMPAERGSVLTLLYPKFTVVVPEPDIINVPLAYPLARRDQAWAAFINTWIELKRRDGTIDALCRHWILGRGAVERKPRWSVVRNVLHWVG